MIELKKVIEEYVKQGGNLLIVHDEGGDYSARVNLNDLKSIHM